MYFYHPKFIKKQLSYLSEISFKDDKAGEHEVCKELLKYNKIDFEGEAIIKLELHHETGQIFRVRWIRSSGISELDKLIADDITRWTFEFKDKKTLLSLIVTYKIHLSKNFSREE